MGSRSASDLGRIMFKTEQEMAQRVVTWLKAQGYQVFEEQAVEGSTKRLDIAALRGDGKLWAISCKLTNRTEGIDDGLWWKKHSNLTSIAMPVPCAPEFYRKFAKYMMGYIYVKYPSTILDTVLPPYRKQRTEDLFCKLNPKTADFAPAGMASGKRDTPFNRDLQDLADYLLANDDSSIEDAFNHVQDKSFSGLPALKRALELEIKKGNYPGLYLRKGKVERKIEVGGENNS